jgi:site-specific DNA-methyltransferase (adenine-specific)
MKVTDKITITNEDNMLLMARYPDNYFDLAIVDPPYGIGASNEGRISGEYTVNLGGVKKKVKAKGYTSKEWDNKPPSKEYFLELQRISKNQIIFGANHFIELIPNANSSCWLVWNKKNGDNNNADCELAYTTLKTAVRMFDWKWNGMLQEKMGDLKEERNHPTQKPIALYKWILDKYAKQGDKILDTHLGSGSIAIAAHDYKYDLTACELDKEYYDKAIQRIQNHVAQQKLF